MPKGMLHFARGCSTDTVRVGRLVEWIGRLRQTVLRLRPVPIQSVIGCWMEVRYHAVKGFPQDDFLRRLDWPTDGCKHDPD